MGVEMGIVSSWVRPCLLAEKQKRKRKHLSQLIHLASHDFVRIVWLPYILHQAIWNAIHGNV